MQTFILVLIIYVLIRETALIMAPVQDWTIEKANAIRVCPNAAPCIQGTTVKYYGYVDRDTEAFTMTRPWIIRTIFITPLVIPSESLLLNFCAMKNNSTLDSLCLGHIPQRVWRESTPPEVTTRPTSIPGPSSLLRGTPT